MSSDWPESSQGKSGKRAAAEFVIFSIVTLAAMIFEFGQTLNSYFTSDDLVLVKYVSGIFNGDPLLLFRMFTTPWVPDSSQEIFYRPLVEASFALDFLFSRANPIGYHISNFLYSFVAAIALVSIGRSLAERFELDNASWIGYVAGLLFALSPLHNEVTTWIVGRVDGLCAMFYLISFALFLRCRSKAERFSAVKTSTGLLSLSALLMALLSKEMAFTLPAALFLVSLFSSEAGGIRKKIQQALWETLPYFLILLLFLPLRAMAIGTFVGGYVGALGEAMQKPLGESMIKLTHLVKAIYPYNGEFVSNDSAVACAFHVFYGVAAVYLMMRFCFDRFQKKHLKLLSFLLCWLVLQYLPLLQVFRLSDSLAGARLFYLSTAILALILAIILIPSRRASNPASGKFFPIGSCTLVVFLACLFLVTGRINNQAWILAGIHTLELQQQIKAAVAKLPENRQLLIAYLPSQIFGAFLFNRYYVLEALLSPPLLAPGIAGRVSLLEPRFYIYNMTVPSGVLRRRLAENEKYRTVFWNVDTFKLVDLESPPLQDGEGAPARDGNLPALSVDLRDGLENIRIRSARPIKPSEVRFVEMVLENSQPSADKGNIRRMYFRFEDKPEPPRFLDYWSSAPYDTGLSKQVLRFPVDEVFSWFLLKERQNFQITLGSRGNFKISAVRLLDGRDRRPNGLSAAVNLRSCNDGVVRPISFPIKLNYDVSNVPEAASCLVELSRPYMMFQIENYTYRSPAVSKRRLKTWTVDGTTGSIVLDKNTFPQSGCYQVRIFARKKSGELAGTSSDIIYLGIDDRSSGQDL